MVSNSFNTNYNLNNGYQNFNYKRQAVAFSSNSAEQSSLSYGRDEYMTQPEKKGLSAGNKWGIGLGLTALAAVGIYLTTKRAGNAKQIVNEFKPAKTLEEATAFGNKTLNIHYTDENKANLDMMNTINEWLYKEKFEAKKNIPDFVHFKEENIESPLSLIHNLIIKDKEVTGLGVNTNYINKFDDFIAQMFKPHGKIDLTKLINKNSDNVYQIANPEYKCENLEKLVDKLNSYNKNSSFKDKMEIYDGFSEAVSYLTNINTGKKVVMKNFSDNGAFLHEMGHLNHINTYKFFNVAGEQTSQIYQDFRNDKNTRAVAKQVSNYACVSPLEFVAETYKGLRRGQTYSEEVMNLYKKYNGPSVS